MKKIKVLVAALNWGLGHATRCIPVVKALEGLGCEVIVASDGESLLLLQQEFPELKSIALPPYSVKYSATLPMAISIGLQLPKIAANIRSERRALRIAQVAEHFDLVISDSRFGCRIAGIVNVYMTHQVRIRFPGFFRMFEGLGAVAHWMVWKKFDWLWVIDRPGGQSLSGEMGHSRDKAKTRYVGILSRFSDVSENPPKNIDICFLVSGPQPHRSGFERAILDRQWPANKKYRLIRGLPRGAQVPAMPGNWTIDNHLPSARMREAMMSSKLIVCRSGYSTIMDLARLGLGAVLVPTPGQPEQEYLAAYMTRRMGWTSLSQRAFEKNGITLETLEAALPFRERDDAAMLQAALGEALARAGVTAATA